MRSIDVPGATAPDTQPVEHCLAKEAATTLITLMRKEAARRASGLRG